MPLSTGQVLNSRYRIVKLLGQGGFGAVYRAWDLNLQQPCALKENLDVSEESLRQFEREARMLSGLHHPNLPRVTDYFLIPSQGQYLVMDFVEGEDLQSRLDKHASNSSYPGGHAGGLPEDQVIQWIIQVCDALSYLHRQNPPIIHRDIKPANIRITPNGKAVLVDFGIAKVYQPGHKTTIGARAATPGYSPPEQFGTGTTDERSDIYALGATVYHLLSGEVPPSAMVIVAGRAAPPQPLSQINPNISPGTSNIVMQALEMNHRSRPTSVTEFTAGLRSQGMVAAQRYPPAPVINPAANYNQAQVLQTPTAVPAAPTTFVPKTGGIQTWHVWAGAALIILVLAVGAVFATRDRSPKATQRAVAVPIATNPSRQETAVPTKISIKSTPTRTPTPTRPPLPELPVSPGTQVPFPAESITMDNTDAIKELAQWGRGQPFRFAMSPDGQILAAGSGLGVYLVDAYTQQELKFIPSGFTRAVAISPDSQLLAVGALNQPLRVYRIPSGQLVSQYDSPEAIPWSLAFSPDNSHIAAGYSNNEIHIWEAGPTASRTATQILTGHEGRVTGLAYLPDNYRLASISSDKTVRLWNTADSTQLQSFTGHPYGVRSIDLSPDGNTLATADLTGDLRLWDLSAGREIQQFTLDSGVYSMAFSPDGQRLAAGQTDGNLVMIQLGSNNRDLYPLHKWVIYGLDFSPDGQRLYSMSPDGWLRTWDAYGLTEITPGIEYSSFVNALKFAPGNSPAIYTLAVANAYDRIELWDVRSGSSTRRISGHSGFISGLSYSPDGDQLASASEDGTIKIWNPANGSNLQTIDFPSDMTWVNGFGYSPDGRYLAATSDSQNIYLWDVENGSIYLTLSGDTNGNNSLAFSPPGASSDSLAVGDYSGNIWLWSLPGGSLIQKISTDQSNTVVLAFSPSGEYLVAAIDNNIKFYDTRTWSEYINLDLGDYIYTMSFSPSGDVLAACTGDGDIQLWAVNGQYLLDTLKGHTGNCGHLDFSPDGRFLASGSFDGTVRIWGVP